MDTKYKKSDNKIVITTAVVTERSIESLMQNKLELENLIESIRFNTDRDIATYQANLDGINELIDKADELGVVPLPPTPEMPEISPEDPEDLDTGIESPV